jgi:acetylornithine aminotransferase
MPTYGRYPLELVRGEGVRVWDEEGREYLDFAGGLGTMPLGHSHPRWYEAVVAQARELTMVSNLYFTRPQAQLARRIVDLFDIGDAQVFFGNSGAEANEAAIKVIRKWGLPRGRTKIVALEGSFHGRSVATLAATGQPPKRAAFEPLVDWFEFVPPGDVETLDAVVGEGTAAVMLEPVMGEGGVRPLSHEFLQAARDITTERGVLLFADEVQSGVGRCGGWRASQLSDVMPDVFTLAKGLGGGLPISATVTRKDLSFEVGDHASTFGAGPVVCAAGLAVLEVIEEEGLLDNALKQGEAIQNALSARFQGNPLVSDVRGRGLLIGVELDGSLAKEVVVSLMSDGMLVTEASPDVVRLSPPLMLSAAEAQEGIEKISASIEQLGRRVRA